MTAIDEDTASETLDRTDRRRIAAFVVVCTIALLLGLVGVLMALADRDKLNSSASADGPGGTTLDMTAVDEISGSPVLLFANTSIDDGYGKLAAVPSSTPSAARRVSDMACERVSFRSGHGLCLRSDRGFITTYDAVVFDAALNEHSSIGLAGSPSRAQISPSGSLGAATVFVTGHSYAEGGFSTQTILIDLDDGSVIGDLEVDFNVERDGDAYREVDFNFWGVTFVDDNRFYATLGTGDEFLLVDGDVAARKMTVVHDDVECPSLSPDGTRLAYKIRSDPGVGPVTWRIGVLDLSTMETTVVAETRNVDDQVAWLDDSTLMYGLHGSDGSATTDTWAVPSDGTGEPRLLVPGSWSTVTVDPSATMTE